jgi:hypothetical protein
MRKQIIAALFSLCPLLAEAADWYKFNENEERVDLVDRSTVVRKGTHVTSWSKVKFRVPQVYKGGEAAGALYIAANYFEGSDVDGSLTYSEKPIPGEQPYFVPVAPDSIGEAWMKYVCSSANRKDE